MPRKRKSRKRGNGDGSVFFRKSKGRWYAQITKLLPDGSTKQISRTASSRASAQDKLVEMLANQRPVANGEECQTLLGPYLDQWVKNNPNENAETTQTSYRRASNNHIKPYLEGYRVTEIDTAIIRNWLQAMLSNGVGQATRVRTFSVLSAALTHARREGIIPTNPMSEVKRPPENKPDIQPFTESELERILHYRSGHPLYAAYMLPFICGLRQGEVFGIQWQDIDFKNQTIQIERQACENDGRIIIRPPKWGSFRTVSMTEALSNALKERRKETLSVGSEYVFTSQNNNVMRRSNFGNRHWGPTLKALKIRHRGCHHARHTCITMMLNRGVPIHVVSRVAGHKRTSTTLDIYAHLMSDDSKVAANAMSNFATGNGHVTDAAKTIKIKTG